MNTLDSKYGHRRRVINPRAALILAVAVSVGVFGMRWLHDKQFSRTLQFLRDTAFKSLQKNDFHAAQQQLSQYLAMKSGDPEAREKLAGILSENIRTPAALQQAFRLNEDLLRQGCADDALRLRHARLAVQLGLISDAVAHLKLLQSSQSDNAEVWYLSGVAAEATRDTQGAIRFLQRSLRCSEKIPEAFQALARLATETSASALQPDSLMNQMISQCPSTKAWRIRAEYFMNSGHHAQAIADLWTALKETPDDPALNAMLVRCIQATESLASETVAADSSSSAGPLAATMTQAIRHLRERVRETPHNSNLRACLAAILWKGGERADAIRILEEGVQSDPREFALKQTLVEYLVSAGDTEKAQRILDSIPVGGLPRESISFCRGRILMVEERWKDAAGAFEQALTSGTKNSEIFYRVQLNLAVCRSRSGESGGALESFRHIVAEHPESLAARLGMASEWVRAGQLDLAIAEYRQMQNVQGVSAYLADLLIQKNLQQAASLRSWQEIDNLLREDNPPVSDPVQRVLLRADRLFAAGEIIRATSTLENADARCSGRSEFQSALRRLQEDFAPGIVDRLTQLAKEDPGNAEVRAALVRRYLSADDSDGALAAIAAISGSDATSSSSREKSLLLTIETINNTIRMEQQSNRLEFIPDLENAAITYARQLAALNSDHEREFVRTLVRSGKTEDAVRYLHETQVKARPETRAASLLEVVRSSANRGLVLPRMIQELYSLISQHPQNQELRFYYVDLMLYARQYSVADQTLEPLRKLSNDGRIDARRAWIRAIEERDLADAEEMAQTAVRSNPLDPVFREIQARVFLARNQPEESLKLLQAIPDQSLSLAGQTYLATALLRLERLSEAQAAFDRIHAQNSSDALFPADEDLLKSISDQILQPTTAQR